MQRQHNPKIWPMNPDSPPFGFFGGVAGDETTVLASCSVLTFCMHFVMLVWLDNGQSPIIVGSNHPPRKEAGHMRLASNSKGLSKAYATPHMPVGEGIQSFHPIPCGSRARWIMRRVDSDL